MSNKKIDENVLTNEDMKIVIDELKKVKNKSIDVTLLSDEDSPCVVTEWLSSGCVALDAITGGGFPVGRMTEIYGDNSTGKSLIAAQIASLAQQEGDIVAYVDTETAVSLEIMKVVGVDTDKLLYTAPDTVEDVFTFFESIVDIKNRKFPDKRLLLIWDSVAATSVRFEMENDYGKATMGRHANMISQGMRKFMRTIAKNRICCIFLNQTRMKLGVMFGDNETTFGGKALGFYASIRIQLKIGQKIKENGKIVGVESKAVVVKNKVAVPFLSAKLPIYFGHGIDDALASFQYLIDADLLEKSGRTFTIRDSQLPEFTKQTWYDFYEDNYDAIAKIIMSTQLTDNSDDDDDEDGDEEKSKD